MNPACLSVQSLLPESVRGELDESARARLEVHAAHCADCASALKFQEELQFAIEAEPMAAPPELYFEGVLAEIHRRIPLAAPRRAPSRRRLSREVMATSMTAALMLIWITTNLLPILPWQVQQRDSGGGPTVLAAGARLAAGASIQVASSMVLVRGIGFINADSPLFLLPAETLREVILPVGPAMAHW